MAGVSVGLMLPGVVGMAGGVPLGCVGVGVLCAKLVAAQMSVTRAITNVCFWVFMRMVFWDSDESG